MRTPFFYEKGFSLTDVYIARPAPVEEPATPPQSYSVSPDARAWTLTNDMKEPLKYPVIQKGLYMPDAGASFDFEINIFDPSSKRPIRGVFVESGLVKGFTDRLGRIVMHLPRGRNKVVIEGAGFVESGGFTPESVKFEPIALEVDLDDDAIYNVYSTGEVVPGERRADNPGHNPGHSSALPDWLRQNWWVLGLVGVTGIGLYYFGKSKNPSN